MTTPRVSIVTTVYDRVACLQRCLRSMQHSALADWEQIVVSDAPSPGVVAQVAALVAGAGTRVSHLNLGRRANDWGMTPAWAGLRAARGAYVCFLSDDNAYLPQHFTPLVDALDADPALGFAYSSCRYAGRTVLNVAPPQGARIDLGQPLFRRSVLLDVFPSGLPSREFAWDWRMIGGLVERGVPWRHIDAQTFIFRLAAYPDVVRLLA
jgi:hypothetical protein